MVQFEASGAAVSDAGAGVVDELEVVHRDDRIDVMFRCDVGCCVYKVDFADEWNTSQGRKQIYRSIVIYRITLPTQDILVRALALSKSQRRIVEYQSLNSPGQDIDHPIDLPTPTLPTIAHHHTHHQPHLTPPHALHEIQKQLLTLFRRRHINLMPHPIHNL